MKRYVKPIYLGGILNVLVVEEGKASATPTVAIQHNIHPLQGAEPVQDSLTPNIPKVVFSDTFL